MSGIAIAQTEEYSDCHDRNQMKNHPSRQLAIALSVTLALLGSLNLTIFAPAADAACRPTGRFIGGKAVLKCSGTTRCRPTGRYQTVRGVRYRLLRCPG